MVVNNPLRLSSMDHYRYTDALYISVKLKIKVTKIYAALYQERHVCIEKQKFIRIHDFFQRKMWVSQATSTWVLILLRTFMIPESWEFFLG